ncbi:ATP-binding cassette domain-containing protein [Hyphobacterium sp. HN65]|uniref:ATP-binding cassette domain-containing protein n=1 Tax=Hyphobacterium lacteum TaxID=3116575 RepID=A0ABU7LNX1_9PROT|nr:ATP-binding cassette domain-containing protein [Hyphobacterium sp. HN65]MEE2525619.1 ATP-binding cassette domain-containing protein [Hyphobacterium sp. HN65]
MTETILSLDGVTKRYSGQTAVDAFDLEVKRGEITGFLGPNGAGKTTSLRMSLGIIRPDAGAVHLFGKTPGAKVLERVGFLPEERGIYKKMKAEDVIVFFGRMKGMTMAAARKAAVDGLERFGLGDARGKKIKEMSKGMAQKVQIIATMAHDPEFIILDEPFSGLDPVNQKMLEDMIREEARRGKTVLFSTHVMEHAERLCDKIVLISKGRKVFDGSVPEALSQVPRRVIIETSGDHDLGQLLADTGSVSTQDAPDGLKGWVVDLAAGKDAQDVLKACVEAGVRLARFEPMRAHLHDVFVELVQGSSREAV